MRSFPIWNKITACIYKADRSYGVRETGDVSVVVGTSKSNSHAFVDHSTTHRLLENGDREYRFYVDRQCIKSAVLKKGASELTWLSDATWNSLDWSA